jgi:putative ABC transport system permease protein
MALAAILDDRARAGGSAAAVLRTTTAPVRGSSRCVAAVAPPGSVVPAACGGKEVHVIRPGVPLARRHLVADPGRLAMSVGGVAFAVLLVLLVLSLYRGWSGFGRFYTTLPGNTWVSQRGASDPFHSTSSLPAGRGLALARIPGVRSVIPVYARTVRMGRSGPAFGMLFMALGLQPGASAPGSSRAYFPSRGHVTLDSVYAHDAGVHTGSTVTILGHRFVVGHVIAGGLRIFEVGFLNAGDARRLFSMQGHVSYYLLSTSASVSGARLTRTVPGSELQTSVQLADGFRREVSDNFLPVVGVLLALGFLVGGAVIAITTYTATVERSRDYGVLKAVGASSLFLYRIVVAQSLMIGVAGAAIGIATAALAAHFIVARVPEFVTDVRPLDTLEVFLVAVIVSVAAGYVPVRRVDRIDPAEVFRA